MPHATRRSLGALLFFGALYCLIGVVFAEFTTADPTSSTTILWRRLAWVVSGLAFGGHLIYEQVLRGSSPRRAGTLVSLAAATGAFGLAVAANVHGWRTGGDQRSLAVALIAWPLLVFVPAFVVAFGAAIVVSRWRGRT